MKGLEQLLFVFTTTTAAIVVLLVLVRTFGGKTGTLLKEAVQDFVEKFLVFVSYVKSRSGGRHVNISKEEAWRLLDETIKQPDCDRESMLATIDQIICKDQNMSIVDLERTPQERMQKMREKMMDHIGFEAWMETRL